MRNILTLCISGIIFTLMTNPAAAFSELENAVLTAEAAPKEQAAAAWKKVISHLESGQTAPGINMDIAAIHQAQALLSALPDQAGHSMQMLREVQNAINLLPIRQRFWAQLLLCRKTKEHCHLLEQYWQLLATRADKSHAAYGVIYGLKNVISSHGLQRIWLPRITTARHRAEARHLLAKGSENASAVSQSDETSQLAEAKNLLAKGAFKQALLILQALPDAGKKSQRETALLKLAEQAITQEQSTLAQEAWFSIFHGGTQDRALRNHANHLVNQRQLSEAEQVARHIWDGRYAAEVYLKLAKNWHRLGQSTRADWAVEKALKSIERLRRPHRKNEAIIDLTEGLLGLDKCEEARTLLNSIDQPNTAVSAKRDGLLRKISDAEKTIGSTKSNDVKEFEFKDLTNVSAFLDQKSTHAVLLSKATEEVRKLSDYRRRSAGFRAIAEHQAKLLGLLELQPKTTAETTLKPHQRPLRYPEKLTLTRADIAADIPAPAPASFTLQPYHISTYNEKFLDVIGHRGFQLQQPKEAVPLVLLINEGVADLPTIHHWLKQQHKAHLLTRSKRDYHLSIPIIIGANATLVISNAETDHLKLSQQSGAFITTIGKLYISDTRLTGWDDTGNQPAILPYKDRKIFRPFLLGWSRSEMHIGGSELTALGYSGSKSYGISYSSGPYDVTTKSDIPPRRPTGNVVDNSFREVYYGFYAYEADDVAMVGNEYVNNVVYGIDPHDHSLRLTIAFNTAYGSQIKHGIIISRGVNHSEIIGNLTFDNHGSGFMIDRISLDTTMAANTAFNNRQDGITIFESPCNWLTQNAAYDNDADGIKIRNSTDILITDNILQNNGKSGIEAYTDNLQQNPLHQHRDFALDPYGTVVSFTAKSNHIEQNGSGIATAGALAASLKDNRFIHQSPKILRGELFAQRGEAWLATAANNPLNLRADCHDGSWLPYAACPLRSAGMFGEDGQDDLEQALPEMRCTKITEKLPDEQSVKEGF